MKKLLILLTFLTLNLQAQTIVSKAPVVCETITEMQAKPVDTKARYIVYNALSPGDNMGGVYYFDSTSTEAVDNVYFNVVKPNAATVGRLKRTNTRNIQLTHGLLEVNGGVKTFVIPATLSATGEATVNLTFENTATGTKIFTGTPTIVCTVQPTVGGSTSVSGNDISFGQGTKFSSDMKQVTVAFSRGNTGIGIILGLRNSPAGTPISIIASGM